MLLVVTLVAAPLHAQSEDDDGTIHFDPTITDEQFEQFSLIVGQAIYATPVEPARATGLLGFDVGIAATAVEVDSDSEFWQAATDSDVDKYLFVPRLVVSKGLGAATIAGTYARIPDLDLELWGGSLDFPIINGGIVKPTLAVRASYSTLQGIDEYDCKTYGVEAFLSKGFGPVTPYAAVGRMRVDAEGTIPDVRTLSGEFDSNRYTVGVRLSFLLPKFVVEATQAEERSYSAKVSIGW